MEAKTITTADLDLIQDAILRSIERLQIIIEYAQYPEEWAIELKEILNEANDTIEYISL
jgi:hypothetical protein